jgi:hypothetical protein
VARCCAGAWHAGDAYDRGRAAGRGPRRHVGRADRHCQSAARGSGRRGSSGPDAGQAGQPAGRVDGLRPRLAQSLVWRLGARGDGPGGQRRGGAPGRVHCDPLQASVLGAGQRARQRARQRAGKLRRAADLAAAGPSPGPKHSPLAQERGRRTRACRRRQGAPSVNRACSDGSAANRFSSHKTTLALLYATGSSLPFVYASLPTAVPNNHNLVGPALSLSPS